MRQARRFSPAGGAAARAGARAEQAGARRGDRPRGRAGPRRRETASGRVPAPRSRGGSIAPQLLRGLPPSPMRRRSTPGAEVRVARERARAPGDATRRRRRQDAPRAGRRVALARPRAGEPRPREQAVVVDRVARREVRPDARAARCPALAAAGEDRGPPVGGACVLVRIVLALLLLDGEELRDRPSEVARAAREPREPEARLVPLVAADVVAARSRRAPRAPRSSRPARTRRSAAEKSASSASAAAGSRARAAGRARAPRPCRRRSTAAPARTKRERTRRRGIVAALHHRPERLDRVARSCAPCGGRARAPARARQASASPGAARRGVRHGLAQERQRGAVPRSPRGAPRRAAPARPAGLAAVRRRQGAERREALAGLRREGVVGPAGSERAPGAPRGRRRRPRAGAVPRGGAPSRRGRGAGFAGRGGDERRERLERLRRDPEAPRERAPARAAPRRRGASRPAPRPAPPAASRARPAASSAGRAGARSGPRASGSFASSPSSGPSASATRPASASAIARRSRRLGPGDARELGGGLGVASRVERGLRLGGGADPEERREVEGGVGRGDRARATAARSCDDHRGRGESADRGGVASRARPAAAVEATPRPRETGGAGEPIPRGGQPARKPSRISLRGHPHPGRAARRNRDARARHRGAAARQPLARLHALRGLLRSTSSSSRSRASSCAGRDAFGDAWWERLAVVAAALVPAAALAFFLEFLGVARRPARRARNAMLAGSLTGIVVAVTPLVHYRPRSSLVAATWSAASSSCSRCCGEDARLADARRARPAPVPLHRRARRDGPLRPSTCSRASASPTRRRGSARSPSPPSCSSCRRRCCGTGCWTCTSCSGSSSW